MSARLRLRALLLLPALLLFSCGGGDDSLVGDWTVVKAEGVAAELAMGNRYQFKDGGQLVLKFGDTFTLKMSYETAGDTLTITEQQNEMSMSTKYLYRLEEGRLLLDQVSSDQKLVLEK